jgi:hypothetical protein
MNAGAEQWTLKCIGWKLRRHKLLVGGMKKGGKVKKMMKVEQLKVALNGRWY